MIMNKKFFRKRSLSDSTFVTFNSLWMVFLIFITGYPIVHLLWLSLSGKALGNGFLLWPQDPTLRYYSTVIKDEQVLHSALISVARTVLGTSSMLLITSAAAFGMSDRELVGHKFLWKVFIIPMFIGGGMIPYYLLMKALHLTRTFWIYVIPGLFGGTYNMILIKTFVEQLPNGLIDAAEIDGANDLQTFFKLVIPLSTPILATIGLMSAIGHWNSYTDTMIYNAEVPNLHTLQYTLMLLLNKYSNTSIEAVQELAKQNDKTNSVISPIGLKAALTFVTIIPIMCVYPFLQRYFVKGLLIGAIKA